MTAFTAAAPTVAAQSRSVGSNPSRHEQTIVSTRLGETAGLSALVGINCRQHQFVEPEVDAL